MQKNKQSENLINQSLEDNPCSFLVIMANISSLLLFILNVFIAYNIFLFFTDEGFQFIAGLLLATVYIITIPINIFFVLQGNRIHKKNRNPSIFFIIISVITILIGLILYIATPYWPLISIYGLILFIASIICNKNKKKSPLLQENM